jgi:hypothetical protein
MKALAGFLILAFLFPLHLLAGEVSETFSSRLQYESGTAVWNQALGKIHPSLQVINYTGGGAFTPRPFSVGDGSDGPFEVTTYSKFSLNGDISGNKIRLDTNRYPVLKVTSFHLAPGWVLEPTGNVPLVIYSLTDVRIEGEIWCQGRDGGNAVGATPGSGGLPRCGGTAGGDGGAVGQNGTSGANVNASVTGGEGGNFDPGPSVGGGGGGSWNTSAPALDGNQVNPSGGHKGSSFSDAEFLTIAGGAGGGGGGSTNTDAGAGGGAGGGVVIIHAVGNVEIGTSPSSMTGFIYANGGNGGSSNVAGGPGGSGGGGSVQVFSGDTINVYNEDLGGASQANSIHPNPPPPAAPVPGQGSIGRSWFASVNYHGSGPAYYFPGEDAPVVPDNNTVEFIHDGNQNIITKSFDLQSTMATIDSYTFTPSVADFQMEFKGSSDDFSSDDTGWTTDLSLVAHKRYLKMKLKIATATPFNPTMMDQVSVAYTASEKRDFEFKSSGCGQVGPLPPSTSGWALSLLALPFGLWFLLRQRRGLMRRS